MKISRLSVLLTLIPLFFASFAIAQDLPPDGHPVAIAQAEEFVAREDTFAGFSIKSAHRQEFDLSGTHVDYLQLFNDATREHRKLILAEDGTVLENRFAAFDQNEIAAREKYGKLSPEVHDVVMAAAPEDVLKLKLWGKTPRQDVAKPTVFYEEADVDDFLLQHRSNLRQLNAMITSQMAEAVSPFARVFGKLDNFPVLLIDIEVGNVALLQAVEPVLRVEFRVDENTQRELHNAGYSQFYDADDAETVETWAADTHGTGVRAGVMENARYCGIWDGHPGFSDLQSYSEMAGANLGENGCSGLSDGTLCPVNCNDGDGYCRAGRCFKDHAMQVASKLGSNKGTEVRNASEMALYFANSGTDEERLDWFVENNVTIANHSYGNQGSALIADMDYMIRNHFITVTKSAGNSQAEEVDCYPNSVCVGSYSIVDPANVDHWKEDPGNSTGKYKRSGSTSFKNASAFPDAEKPDVVGNGEASLVSPMASARVALWDTTAFGTSFAAPMVGGMVALLQEEWPPAKVWPEVVRPMLMVAGRMHNIEGARLSRNDAGGDEWDGAGVPTASALKLIISNQNYKLFSLEPSDFNANGDIDVTSLFLGQGRTARVVAGWMYCSDGGRSFLATDLDLYLVDSAYGSIADLSASATNSLEMVEYRNISSARRFAVKLRQYGSMKRCGNISREYVGVAWSVY